MTEKEKKSRKLKWQIEKIGYHLNAINKNTGSKKADDKTDTNEQVNDLLRVIRDIHFFLVCFLQKEEEQKKGA